MNIDALIYTGIGLLIGANIGILIAALIGADMDDEEGEPWE